MDCMQLVCVGGRRLAATANASDEDNDVTSLFTEHWIGRVVLFFISIFFLWFGLNLHTYFAGGICVDPMDVCLCGNGFLTMAVCGMFFFLCILIVCLSISSFITAFIWMTMRSAPTPCCRSIILANWNRIHIWLRKGHTRWQQQKKQASRKWFSHSVAYLFDDSVGSIAVQIWFHDNGFIGDFLLFVAVHLGRVMWRRQRHDRHSRRECH